MATTHPKGEVEGEENMSWTGQMKCKRLSEFAPDFLDVKMRIGRRPEHRFFLVFGEIRWIRGKRLDPISFRGHYGRGFQFFGEQDQKKGKTGRSSRFSGLRTKFCPLFWKKSAKRTKKAKLWDFSNGFHGFNFAARLRYGTRVESFLVP